VAETDRASSAGASAREAPHGGRWFAVAILLALALLFVFDHDAWTPDEPRVAELAHSIHAATWAVPTLNGTPFLEQPPLYYWAVAAAYAAFGTSVGVARTVSSLFGLLTIVICYAFAARLGGRRVGLLAALSLGLSAEFFWISHRVVVDSALACFVTAAAAAALRGLTEPSKRARAGWLALCYAAASLAYLSKGVVGLGLSGFAFLAVVAALRRPRLLLESHLWAAPLIFAVLTAPYHLELYRELGATGLRTVTVAHTVGRAGGEMDSHVQPWHYYLPLLLPCLLPSGLFFVGGVGHYVLGRRGLSRTDLFAFEVPLFWLAMGLVGLSLAASKRELYLTPLLPAAATISGLWLERIAVGQARSRYARLLPGALVALLAVSAVALPVAAVAFHLAPAAAVTAGVAGLAIAAASLAELRRWSPLRAIAAVALGIVCVLAGVVFTWVPWIDEQKSFASFFATAAPRVPSSGRIFVLRPDETASGVIPFYTQRLATPLRDAADLDRALASGAEAYVYVIDKDPAMSRYQLIAQRPHRELASEIRPSSRSLRLLYFRGPHDGERP
jgi:4-amino-4-deoxy-L-arabinose transferase-like glycosyltransferase